MKDNNSTIEEQLFPKGTFQPSDSLKNRIMDEAKSTEPTFARKTSKFKKIILTAVSAAAVLAIIIVARPFIKQAYSMESQFHKASEYFTKASSFVADIDARTTPSKNFAYIDVGEDFVHHKLSVQPASGCWRLEKSERVAMYDGKNTWLWNPQKQFGHKWAASREGVIEDFAILTDPFMMLELETDYLRYNPKAICKKSTKNGLVTFVLEAPAHGDYENDYLRNTSLEDMDTYREYVFEKKSGRLLRLKISTKIDGRTTTVFEMKNIEYNITLDASTFTVPDGYEWKVADADFDVKDAVVKSFVGIPAEKAVEMAFAAMHDWDTTVLNVVLMEYDIKELKKQYEGCQLMGHKEAFHSGRYAGVFVPCRIRMKDQSIRELNVAIRKDNKQKVWLFDGGI